MASRTMTNEKTEPFSLCIWLPGPFSTQFGEPNPCCPNLQCWLHRAKEKKLSSCMYTQNSSTLNRWGGRGHNSKPQDQLLEENKKSSVFSFVIVRPKASLGTFFKQDLSKKPKAHGTNQRVQRSGRMSIKDNEVHNKDGSFWKCHKAMGFIIGRKILGMYRLRRMKGLRCITGMRRRDGWEWRKWRGGKVWKWEIAMRKRGGKGVGSGRMWTWEKETKWEGAEQRTCQCFSTHYGVMLPCLFRTCSVPAQCPVNARPVPAQCPFSARSVPAGISRQTCVFA